MDSVDLISRVFSAQESARSNDRQIAVAANAARSEQATVEGLLQAIEVSSYGGNGQLRAPAAVGTQFAATA